MSGTIVIRLQFLPNSAKAVDIRQFFIGLRIPEGAVQIVGGPTGDAFIGFITEDEGLKALELSGQTIQGQRVVLKRSSKEEMQFVLDQAYQGFPQGQQQQQPPATQQMIPQPGRGAPVPTGQLGRPFSHPQPQQQQPQQQQQHHQYERPRDREAPREELYRPSAPDNHIERGDHQHWDDRSLPQHPQRPGPPPGQPQHPRHIASPPQHPRHIASPPQQYRRPASPPSSRFEEEYGYDRRPRDPRDHYDAPPVQAGRRSPPNQMRVAPVVPRDFVEHDEYERVWQPPVQQYRPAPLPGPPQHQRRPGSPPLSRFEEEYGYDRRPRDPRDYEDALHPHAQAGRLSPPMRSGPPMRAAPPMPRDFPEHDEYDPENSWNCRPNGPNMKTCREDTWRAPPGAPMRPSPHSSLRSASPPMRREHSPPPRHDRERDRSPPSRSRWERERNSPPRAAYRRSRSRSPVVRRRQISDSQAQPQQRQPLPPDSERFDVVLTNVPFKVTIAQWEDFAAHNGVKYRNITRTYYEDGNASDRWVMEFATREGAMRLLAADGTPLGSMGGRSLRMRPIGIADADHLMSIPDKFGELRKEEYDRQRGRTEEEMIREGELPPTAFGAFSSAAVQPLPPQRPVKPGLLGPPGGRPHPANGPRGHRSESPAPRMDPEERAVAEIGHLVDGPPNDMQLKIMKQLLMSGVTPTRADMEMAATLPHGVGDNNNGVRHPVHARGYRSEMNGGGGPGKFHRPPGPMFFNSRGRGGHGGPTRPSRFGPRNY